jgi:hypothetical protein
MAKGDFISVLVRTGNGATTDTKVEAQQNGRNIGYEWVKDGNIAWLVVKEITRGGTTVVENRFAASEVVQMTVSKRES